MSYVPTLKIFHALLGATPPTPPALADYFDESAGTFPWYGAHTYPSAIYVASTTTTWFAWEVVRGGRFVYVTTYNHTTSQWTDPVIVASIPLANDSHGVPALCRDAGGYVHCFYGGHDSDFYESVTTAADNPAEWDRQTTFSAADYSYPHPVMVGSAMYLFFRKAVSSSVRTLVLYVTSSITSGVPTWGSELPVVTFGTDTRVYAGTVLVDGTDIHVTTTRAHSADTMRRDVHHFVYDTTDGSVDNSDGSVSTASGSLPVDLTLANASYRVVAQTTTDTNVPGMCFDTSGDLHLVYMDGTRSGVNLTSCDLKHIVFTGGSWSSPVTVVSGLTLSYSELVALVPLPSAEIALYYPEDAGGSWARQGGDIKRVVRSSGGTWGSAATVLSATTHAVAGITALTAPHADARVIFTEVTEDDNNSSAVALKKYAHGDGGFVGREAPETFEAAVVPLTIGTGAATTTYTTPTVPFEPVVAVFMGSGSALDVAGSTHIRQCFGVAISTTERACVAAQVTDGADPMSTDSVERDDACVATLTTSGATDGLADFSAFNWDGTDGSATVVIDDQFAASYDVLCWLLGAQFATSAKLVQFTEPGATGNQAVTGAGFQPDAVILFSCDSTAANTPAGDAALMVGVGTSGTAMGVLYGKSDDARGTSIAEHYVTDAEILAGFDATASNAAGPFAVDAHATLVSLDADGFTLNWTERTARARRYWALCLAGPAWKAGSTLVASTVLANQQHDVTGVGFRPRTGLVLVGGGVEATADTSLTNNAMAVGAFAGIEQQGAAGTMDRDANTAADCAEVTATGAAGLVMRLSGTSPNRLTVASTHSDGLRLLHWHPSQTALPANTMVLYLVAGE